MAGPLDGILARLRRTSASPTKTLGTPGTAVYGGYVVNGEQASELADGAKYRTYSNMLANVSVVAAGVRYFLNLTAKADWSFVPSEADVDGRYAELAEAMLTDDPSTPFHRVIRRAAMYRFYGFSVQEWTARRRPDGFMTYSDISPRAQRTIERWDIEDDGNVLGVIQTSPQNSREIYMPRSKLVYMVDDTLNDSPEGLGLFRHLVAPAKRLARYEQLEGIGFDSDLRGVPVGRGPFTRLAEMVEAGQISEAQRIQIEKPIRDFVKEHIKTPQLGLLLDSRTYETEDEAKRPSSTPQWDVDLLKGGTTGLADVAGAIGRVNREMARILGVEQLMLGEGQSGSFALSRDKTQAFFLLVDGTLREIGDSFETDLIWPMWQMNGLDPALMPTMSNQAVQFQDVEQIASALRDMAQAGAVLAPDDPAINEVRDLLGLSRQPDTSELDAEDAALGGDKTPEGEPDNPEKDLPDDETQGGR